MSEEDALRLCRSLGQSAKRSIEKLWREVHESAGVSVPALPGSRVYVGHLSGGGMKVETVYGRNRKSQ